MDVLKRKIDLENTKKKDDTYEMTQGNDLSETFNFDWKLEPKEFKESIWLKKKFREYPNHLKINGFILNDMGII